MLRSPEQVEPTAGVAVGMVKGVAAGAGARAPCSSRLHAGDFDLELGCPRRDQTFSFFDCTTTVTEGGSVQRDEWVTDESGVQRNHRCCVQLLCTQTQPSTRSYPPLHPLVPSIRQT
jgi:hypothetical protein